MGFLHYDPTPMTEEIANELLAQTQYFDYVKGRVMKVDLKKNEFDERLYDRDNGHGAAQSAINEVLKGQVNSEKLQEDHNASKSAAALEAYVGMQTPTKYEKDCVTMGLDDVADILGPAVKKALNPES